MCIKVMTKKRRLVTHMHANIVHLYKKCVNLGILISGNCLFGKTLIDVQKSIDILSQYIQLIHYHINM